MKIITLNANGLRSAINKGLIEWIEKENPDTICFQEIKAKPEQIKNFNILNYYYIHSAEKSGYSGVAIYLKEKPNAVMYGIGWEDIDKEGRFIEAKFNQFSIISLYVHSGSSGDERQIIKEDFLDRFYDYLQSRRNENLIICGDLNIAHTNKDIRNWKGNLKNSGFLPQERAWLDKLFNNGYIDAFRFLNKEEHQYTWWSNRGQARKNNVGWRIDYQIISQSLTNNLISTKIYTENKFSDHAPLIVEYKF